MTRITLENYNFHEEDEEIKRQDRIVSAQIDEQDEDDESFIDFDLVDEDEDNYGREESAMDRWGDLHSYYQRETI